MWTLRNLGQCGCRPGRIQDNGNFGLSRLIQWGSAYSDRFMNAVWTPENSAVCRIWSFIPFLLRTQTKNHTRSSLITIFSPLMRPQNNQWLCFECSVCVKNGVNVSELMETNVCARWGQFHSGYSRNSLSLSFSFSLLPHVFWYLSCWIRNPWLGAAAACNGFSLSWPLTCNSLRCNTGWRSTNLSPR